MKQSKIILYLEELRAPFFTASVIPVLVGTAMAYAAYGTVSLKLFILAVLGMVAIHGGSNVANDYFDHLSGNDWRNKNKTPFSGGSRMIQQGLLSPKQVLAESITLLAAGAIFGIAIVIITKSLFVFWLGIIGVLGGYFYTARPLQLGYRTSGETVIALLFGILPVYGSYYIQTMRFEFWPLIPAAIIAILIFLVILINEFPDAEADGAVNKKTLVVAFGKNIAANIYKWAIVAGFLLAAAAPLVNKIMLIPAILYLLLLPMCFSALKHLKQDVTENGGGVSVNRMTILLHLFGGLAISAGFLVYAIIQR